MAIVGLIVFLTAGAFVVAWNPKPAERPFSCPRCNLYITRETSQVNCVYCGYPMSWPADEVKTHMEDTRAE